MDVLENLGLLHNRAQNLNYNDRKELDDIIQKSKMYISSYFTSKPIYSIEIGQISFTPTYSIGNIGDSIYRSAWEDGKNKLVNLLDTRIKEIKLLEKQKNDSIPSNNSIKIGDINDKRKIEALEKQISILNSKPKGYSNTTKFFVISTTLLIISSAFWLGKFFGENRFDREKIELTNEKQLLREKLDSVLHENTNLKTKVEFLEQFAPPEVTEDSNLYCISVSYTATLAIFDGKVEISAQKKNNSAELLFIGLNKLWKSSNEKIIDNKITVSKGDKFNIQEKNGKTWSIEVIEVTPKVKMEIYPLF